MNVYGYRGLASENLCGDFWDAIVASVGEIRGAAGRDANVWVNPLINQVFAPSLFADGYPSEEVLEWLRGAGRAVATVPRIELPRPSWVVAGTKGPFDDWPRGEFGVVFMTPAEAVAEANGWLKATRALAKRHGFRVE